MSHSIVLRSHCLSLVYLWNQQTPQYGRCTFTKFSDSSARILSRSTLHTAGSFWQNAHFTALRSDETDSFRVNSMAAFDARSAMHLHSRVLCILPSHSTEFAFRSAR
jgi:hypothetical protein